MILFLILNLIFIGIGSASVISVPKIDDDTIGITAVDLDARNCQKEECNVGNLIADAIHYEYLIEHTTGTKVADVLVLLQSKNFNGMIEQGTEIKENHVTSLFSKTNGLVKGKLKGSVIINALDDSVKKYTQKNGSPDFLQISGGLLEFDFDKDEGIKKITVAQVLCTDCNSFLDIKSDNSYDVVMTEDLSKATFSNENFTGLNKTDKDTFQKYIKQHQVVYPAVEGRVILHNTDKAPEGNSGVTVKVSTLLIGIMFLFQKFMSSV